MRTRPGNPFEARCRGCYQRALYRGSSLARKLTPLGPYRRLMPRVLNPEGVGVFLWARYPCMRVKGSAETFCAPPPELLVLALSFLSVAVASGVSLYLDEELVLVGREGISCPEEAR